MRPLLTRRWTGTLAALALLAPGSASGQDGTAIDHARVECVPYDRYTRIAAARAEGVVSAQLQFRPEGGGGWYSIGMVAEGSQWTAVLPLPIRPLSGLEYRIVTRSSDAGEEAGAAIAVRVGGDAACARGARSTSALDAPIVVRVPSGAPLVPPVPSGFSPAGVVAAEEPPRSSVRKQVAVGAGVLGIGAAAAIGIGTIGEPRVVEDVPEFFFVGTAPVPGRTLSLARDQLSVFLRLEGQGSVPYDFGWSFEMLRVGGLTTCVTLFGTASVGFALPATVTLTAPLSPTGACGERFDVDRSFLRISRANRLIFQSFVTEVPFHFEP